MKVKEVYADPRKKPLDGVEDLAKNRSAKKALWIGVKVAGLTRVPWYGLNDLRERPTLLGIIYHTIRHSRHPSGNGLHHYFPELLDMPRVAPNGGVYTEENLAVSAFMGAEARVARLMEIFPDKDIQLSSSSPFVPDMVGREEPLTAQETEGAHEYAIRHQLLIP
jgi:hypothetical protein